MYRRGAWNRLFKIHTNRKITGTSALDGFIFYVSITKAMFK